MEGGDAGTQFFDDVQVNRDQSHGWIHHGGVLGKRLGLADGVQPLLDAGLGAAVVGKEEFLQGGRLGALQLRQGGPAPEQVGDYLGGDLREPGEQLWEVGFERGGELVADAGDLIDQMPSVFHQGLQGAGGRGIRLPGS